MPFIATYFLTNDPALDNQHVQNLADRFRRLAHATQGELTLHGDPADAPLPLRKNINGFVIEYESKDPARSTERLGQTVANLIRDFTEGVLERPAVIALERLDAETIGTLAAEVKLALD